MPEYDATPYQWRIANGLAPTSIARMFTVLVTEAAFMISSPPACSHAKQFAGGARNGVGRAPRRACTAREKPLINSHLTGANSELHARQTQKPGKPLTGTINPSKLAHNQVNRGFRARKIPDRGC